MESLAEILNTVLPVFLIIALGWLLTFFGFLTKEGLNNLRKLVFYVSLPILLFKSAANATLSELLNINALAAVIATLVIIGAAAHLVLVNVAPERRGVMVQAIFRGNMVFVGLPIVTYTFGDPGLASVFVLVVFVVPLFNILSVIFLSLPHHTGIWQPAKLKAMAVDVLKNPLIIGCAAGLAVSATGIQFPSGLTRGLDLIGRMALPLALIIVGSSMDFHTVKKEIRASLFVSVGKLVIIPGFAFLLLSLVGQTGIALKAMTLMMATPTSATSYIMAAEMKGDEYLAASLLIMSTLLSLFTIMAWLFLFTLMD